MREGITTFKTASLTFCLNQYKNTHRLLSNNNNHVKKIVPLKIISTCSRLGVQSSGLPACTSEYKLVRSLINKERKKEKNAGIKNVFHSKGYKHSSTRNPTRQKMNMLFQGNCESQFKISNYMCKEGSARQPTVKYRSNQT